MTDRARQAGISWQRIGIAAYIGLNIGLSIFSLSHGIPKMDDWALWTSVPGALESGDLYAIDENKPFVWSPVMGYVMAAVVLFLGFWPWAALHVAVLGLLRDPLLILLTLSSWGFWWDLAGANAFVFVFVSGVLAFRGSRRAAFAYLALFLLMPRPVQVPLAAWILVRQPEVRVPFLAMAVVHAIIVSATGYAGDWIAAVLAYGGDPADIGAGHWIGLWWLVVGVPLGLWLTVRGRPGWAGLAVTPYLLPQYLLMPLLELRRRQDGRDG